MWTTVLTLACAVAYAHGHGRVMHPPNRASLWRFGYNSPANYDDDGLNCGGFYRQWSMNDGRCGACGDAYDMAEPRPHELGGTYGKGYIVASYAPGEVFSTNIYISAYHMGFWEFRICPDPYDTTQECFDQHLVELENGDTKYFPLRGSGTYEVNYRLPSNLVCDHCVLQWKYTAGNNWGFCSNGTQGLGCGNQENFFTCSDISIQGDSTYETEPTTLPTTPPTAAPSTTTPPTTTTTTEADIPVDVPIIDLNGELLKLLMMVNEIQDVRPAYGNSQNKYISRHKRKKNSKKTKRRKYNKILYRR